MADFSGDPEQLKAYRRFIEEIEMALRAANREIIGKQIPELDKESFFRLAVSVAKLRANYLKAVLGVDWEDDGINIAAVQGKRAVYEEASKAFEALERTIERGYIDISENRIWDPRRALNGFIDKTQDERSRLALHSFRVGKVETPLFRSTDSTYPGHRIINPPLLRDPIAPPYPPDHLYVEQLPQPAGDG